MKKKKPTLLAAITHFPSPLKKGKKELPKAERIDQIATHFQAIMELLGLDLEDSSLAKTPKRVAKMYVEEIFSGLDLTAYPDVTVMEETDMVGKTELILLKVGFTSFCEHHFVPMRGTAYVAYLPNGYFIGFSKIARIVRYFAKRPQLQERLTAQIADSLAIVLQTEHVAVSLTATHFCVVARGVQDETGESTTQVLRGDFLENSHLQQQFLSYISNSK